MSSRIRFISYFCGGIFMVICGAYNILKHEAHLKAYVFIGRDADGFGVMVIIFGLVLVIIGYKYFCSWKKETALSKGSKKRHK